MNIVAAAGAAVGLYLLVTATRSPALSERVGRYLLPVTPVATDEVERGSDVLLERAGLGWSAAELRIRRAMAAGLGAVLGALLAQGDLFVAGAGRSTPGLMVLGAASGRLLFRMWLTTRVERRGSRMRLELPVIADTISLHVIAGASVPDAVAATATACAGVASTELQRVLDDYHAGQGLAEALQRAGRRSVEPQAARLYTLLGQAHRSGGRLADALAELAADYRSGEARALTGERGKRALATYGPILGLMVPVTLMFLMYPTLIGLRQLAGGG